MTACAASIGLTVLDLLAAEQVFDRCIDRAVTAVWIGLGLIAVCCALIGLFTAVTPVTGVAILVAALILNRVRRHPGGFPKMARRAAWICPIVVVGFAWHAATVPVDAYDTGLYHQHAVSWLSQYGFVRGLAWLHFRLGWTSSWFALAALFNHGVLAGRVSALLGGFITTLSFLHWILTVESVMSRRAKAGDWYLLFSYPPLIAAVWVWHYDISLSPDLATWVITILVVWVALLLHSRICDPRARCIPLLMAALGCSFKFSLLPLLPLASIFPAFAGNTFSLRRISLRASAVCCSPLLVTIASNLIVSGCPIYPSAFGCIPTTWAVPTKFAQSVMASTRDFARWGDSGVCGSEASAMWLCSWVYRTDKLILLLLVIAGGVGLIVRAARTRSQFCLWTIGVGFSGLAFLFWGAPNPRFGLGYFVILPAAALSLLVAEKQLEMPEMRVPALACLVAALLVIIIRNDFRARGVDASRARRTFVFPEAIADTEGAPIHIFNRAGDRQSELLARVETNGNLHFLTPVSSDQCWNLPLPCTPELIDRHFQLSPEGLAAGFEKADSGKAEDSIPRTAIDSYPSLVKPVDLKAGTKARLLANGEKVNAVASEMAQGIRKAQSEAAGEENDDRAGLLTLVDGHASFQFKRTYSKPLECIAVDKATRKRLVSKTTTTTLTISGPSGNSALYVCHGE